MNHTTSRPWRPALQLRFRWWMPTVALVAIAVALLIYAANARIGAGWFEPGSARWWLLTIAMHLPLALILFFLVAGIIERLGYFWKGRAAAQPGQLPPLYPTVCVQLPMFNEHAVARRVIEAAAHMTWPAGRLTVQVLDDSTDADTRRLVEQVCRQMRARGIDCRLLHRSNRHGYKAGALEEGRRQTDAEFIVIFDSDFVPPEDFLLRTLPHFYRADGSPEADLSLVQAQWGHLNHDESALTLAQSLWVDDHHTLQMSWRSAAWQFVNFTGTAGVWRAAAVEAVGGWRAASLVEDCELSFRHLFAGYRTKFVKEIVAPAELPATYVAYKAQQRRWTLGWVQLQRLHLKTLLFDYQASPLRRLHLFYHMCISWQWLAWALWLMALPFMVYTNHWLGAFGPGWGLALYLLPTAAWLALSVTLASLETKHTYSEPLTPGQFLKRVARIFPYIFLSAGMLPHQFSAFMEGLFGPMHGEFERTPKAATVTGKANLASQAAANSAPAVKKSDGVKIHWPYVLTELFFVAYQGAWAVLFAYAGLIWCAILSAAMAACVLALVLLTRGSRRAQRLSPVQRRSPA